MVSETETYPIVNVWFALHPVGVLHIVLVTPPEVSVPESVVQTYPDITVHLKQLARDERWRKSNENITTLCGCVRVL